MADFCPTCGSERTMGQCWRLTCPSNGASHGTLALVQMDRDYLGVGIIHTDDVKIERIDPSDVYIPPEAKTMDEINPITVETMSREEMAAKFGIGEKVAHVRAAPNTGDHHCHWPGCEAQVKPAVWGCKKHWYMLPADLRRRIWATFRPGQEQTKTPSREYVEAAQAVQAWIRENHAPRQEKLL